MPTITRVDIIPSLIPNTTMKLASVDGVPRQYEITPNEGYFLHDRGADWYEYDEETNEPLYITKMRYSSGMCSCFANYDFSIVTATDENGNTFTAYGAEREFFARPANEVPSDSTYSNQNDHEVASVEPGNEPAEDK